MWDLHKVCFLDMLQSGVPTKTETGAGGGLGPRGAVEPPSALRGRRSNGMLPVYSSCYFPQPSVTNFHGRAATNGMRSYAVMNATKLVGRPKIGKEPECTGHCVSPVMSHWAKRHPSKKESEEWKNNPSNGGRDGPLASCFEELLQGTQYQ